MTSQANEAAVNEAIKDMLDRAKKELSAHNNDTIAEQFIVAENNVDRFLHAIESRTINFPNSQQLAWSCLTILVVTGELTRVDTELLARLYAPSVSVSMFHIASTGTTYFPVVRARLRLIPETNIMPPIKDLMHLSRVVLKSSDGNAA